MFENKIFSYIIYMTVEYNDIITIKDIKKKYKPRIKKAINNAMKKAINDAVKDIKKKNEKNLYY